MAWALWGIVILFALGTLFIFGFAYVEYTLALLYIYLILFIWKFRHEMHKLKRS